jgi:hypothetical protein
MRRGASAPSLFLLQFLADPDHGTLEVMRAQPFHSANVVILRQDAQSRSEPDAHIREENGALRPALESAIPQQIVENLGNAEALPYLAER